MTLQLRMLFVFLLALVVRGNALACSCSLLTAHDLYRHADAVFVGTAQSKTLLGGGIRFHIEESFWGTKADSIVVKHYDPIVCDSFSFKLGKKYLVVAYKEGDALTTGKCNQGVVAELATGDIRALRAQRGGKSLPQVYGVLTTAEGKPLANVRVTVRSDSNKARVVAETRTHGDGYFQFAKLPTGDYWAVALAPDGKESRKAFQSREQGNRLLMHNWR